MSYDHITDLHVHRSNPPTLRVEWRCAACTHTNTTLLQPEDQHDPQLITNGRGTPRALENTPCTRCSLQRNPRFIEDAIRAVAIQLHNLRVTRELTPDALTDITRAEWFLDEVSYHLANGTDTGTWRWIAILNAYDNPCDCCNDTDTD